MSIVLFAILFQLCAGGPSALHSDLRGGTCGTTNIPCLPGIDALGAGFDIVSGTSIGKQQVIQFTYNNMNNYVNPFNRSVQYLVPDNVTVRDHTGSSQTTESSTFYNSKDFAHSIASDTYVKGSGILFDIAFSASESVKTAQSYLSSSSTYGSYVSAKKKVTLYDVVLPTSSVGQTTSAFRNAWQQLPSTYNSSVTPTFTKFFGYYGTHYIESAIFGGMGVMTSAVNTAYSKEHSSSEISAQASLHFAFLQAGGSGSNAKDSSDQSFTKNSAFSASIVGGDPALGDLQDWSKWIPSFYNAPAMVSYKIRPITELITDASIASAVNQALSDYAGGAWTDNCTNASEKIADLERRLTSGSSTWRYGGGIGDLFNGKVISTSPSALQGIQSYANGFCRIEIYDTDTTPNPNVSPKLSYEMETINPGYFALSVLNVNFPGDYGVAMTKGIAVRIVDVVSSQNDWHGNKCNDRGDSSIPLSITIIYK